MMANKNASGSWTIRKKAVMRDGKQYVYWEARYTAGIDPGTGKQIQRSISGKTQKEVSQKLKAATASLDSGTYTAPNKIPVAEWLDIWADTYLGGVKPFTAVSYRGQIKNHIKSDLGAIKLEALNAHSIQSFYNQLAKDGWERNRTDELGKRIVTWEPLSPKSIKNIHGVLHKALQQAVAVGYIRFNPSEYCTLPRCQRREIEPLDEVQSKHVSN